MVISCFRTLPANERTQEIEEVRMTRAFPGPRPRRLPSERAPGRDPEPETLPDVELPAELAEKVARMTEQADREIAGGTVHFFWGAAHLDPVKRAAALIGAPCWEYIKQATWRQAMSDLAAAGVPLPGPPAPASVDTPGETAGVPAP
jgi:hypothetical protein